MITPRGLRVAILAVFMLCNSGLPAQEEPKLVPLPKPQVDGGKPLMQVLKERKSSREFGPQKLSEQILSNLLWASSGINRPDGRRTAPSAMNRQEIDIYAIDARCTYLYDPGEHALKPVAGTDLRPLAGTQPFAKEAPLTLVYVADFARMGDAKEEDKLLYAGADTGFVAQNAYLYCTSEGLATVVRASVDRPALSKALGLRAAQRIILAQSVGYPK